MPIKKRGGFVTFLGSSIFIIIIIIIILLLTVYLLFTTIIYQGVVLWVGQPSSSS